MTRGRLRVRSRHRVRVRGPARAGEERAGSDHGVLGVMARRGGGARLIVVGDGSERARL